MKIESLFYANTTTFGQHCAKPFAKNAAISDVHLYDIERPNYLFFLDYASSRIARARTDGGLSLEDTTSSRGSEGNETIVRPLRRIKTEGENDFVSPDILLPTSMLCLSPRDGPVH